MPQKRYLFDVWDKIKNKLIDERIFLFMDYDGTLTPIVGRPSKALMSAKTRSLLKKLAALSGYKLAVISGRSLKDIKKRVGLKNVIYVGNHGLEIDGRKTGVVCRIPSRAKAAIRRVKDAVTRELSGVNGLFVEDKGLTLSVHYRLVRKGLASPVRNKVVKIAKPYLAQGLVKINSGKKVLEIRPCVDMDKGKIVLRLLNKERSACGGRRITPIYVGDDATDEDAFKALKNKGVTIFIGKCKITAASFRLRNTKEMIRLLEDLAAMENG